MRPPCPQPEAKASNISFSRKDAGPFGLIPFSSQLSSERKQKAVVLLTGLPPAPTNASSLPHGWQRNFSHSD